MVDADELTEKIRAVIREERAHSEKGVKNAIKIYFNLGLVAIIIVVLMAFGTMDAIALGCFTPGETTILLLICAIAGLFSVVAWDIISGINIIEQKLKILCKEKE